LGSIASNAFLALLELLRVVECLGCAVRRLELRRRVEARPERREVRDIGLVRLRVVAGEVEVLGVELCDVLRIAAVGVGPRKLAQAARASSSLWARWSA
jgi:hypothetical protein